MTVAAHPRTQSRRRALDLLYSADLRIVDVELLLAKEKHVDKVARSIVEGVIANKDEIDGLIRRYATSWTLERMPVVDRNVLRIGIYEALHEPEVPVGVAVNEAVELAKLLSAEESARFINGMLGRITREHPRG
ncbi:MAG: transcription antitermination factor NusB [Actinomycetota bacterium]